MTALAVLVSECNGCPFSHYNGGGQSCMHPKAPLGHVPWGDPKYKLTRAACEILNESGRAKWCPLGDCEILVRLKPA